MTIRIPYGRQDIDADDIAAVQEVLKSAWLTQGPTIDRFEAAVAAHCGTKYAVAVSNATVALHLSCLALDLGPGDEYWTSPNTFVASANCGQYCGANVDFVDVDPRTYNLSAARLEEKLKSAKSKGKLPKLVIPVHFSGQSAEMKKISALSKEYGFSVMEDAAHAIGGRYLGRPIGSCDFSDLTVFSFHPVKVITTGEGGIIVTNRKDLYERLIRLRAHGITRSPALMKNEPHGPWYYEQIELGYNYRMTDIQATLGLSQMKRLSKFVARRHELVKRYDEAFANLPVTCPWQDPDGYSAFHLYVIRLHLDQLKQSRKEIFVRLQEKGIGVNVHYIPVHTQPYYSKMGFKAQDFPESLRYYEAALTLPLFAALTDQDQDTVIAAIREVVR